MRAHLKICKIGEGERSIAWEIFVENEEVAGISIR